MQVRLSRKQESSNLVGVQLYRNVDPEKRLYFKYLFMSIHNTEHNCNQNWYFSCILTWTVADTPTVAIFVGSECRGTGQCLLPLCPGLSQVTTGDQLKQE